MKKALEKIEEKFALSHEEQELKKMVDYTLESIDDYLFIHPENKSELPKLESIDVTWKNGFKSKAKVEIPKLESIDDYLFIHPENKSELPKLESLYVIWEKVGKACGERLTQSKEIKVGTKEPMK